MLFREAPLMSWDKGGIGTFENKHFCEFFTCNISQNQTLVPLTAKVAQLSSINSQENSVWILVQYHLTDKMEKVC